MASGGGWLWRVAHGRYLVDRGCIRPLCDMLLTNDSKAILVSLDAIANILRVGKQIYGASQNQFGVSRGPAAPVRARWLAGRANLPLRVLVGHGAASAPAAFIETAGGVSTMEVLQTKNHDENVYKKCYEIIVTYFQDDDDENQQPDAAPVTYVVARCR